MATISFYSDEEKNLYHYTFLGQIQFVKSFVMKTNRPKLVYTMKNSLFCLNTRDMQCYKYINWENMTTIQGAEQCID